jgi:GMP synthase (glutamine-hydrolysing)
MTTPKPTIVLYLMGNNDFVADLFKKASGYERGLFELEVIRAMKFEEPKYDWSYYAGVIVSGSTAMVTDKHEFANKVSNQLRQIIEQAYPPLLGVCFGHQLLVSELGGQVDWIPERQLGTTQVKLNPEVCKHDPLFSVFSDRVHAFFHVAHRQFVKHLPGTKNINILASCDVDQHYALKINHHAWTVQFHPEMNAKVVKSIIKTQYESLKQDGIDPDVRLQAIQDTDDGQRLLYRFIDICLLYHENNNKKNLLVNSYSTKSNHPSNNNNSGGSGEKIVMVNNKL